MTDFHDTINLDRTGHIRTLLGKPSWSTAYFPKFFICSM